MKIGLCIKYFQVFFLKPKKTYNTRMFESNWKYVTTMIRKLPKLLFFSPNSRQRQSMIICTGSTKATNVKKVTFRKYLQANLYDEQRSF